MKLTFNEFGTNKLALQKGTFIEYDSLNLSFRKTYTFKFLALYFLSSRANLPIKNIWLKNAVFEMIRPIQMFV